MNQGGFQVSCPSCESIYDSSQLLAQVYWIGGTEPEGRSDGEWFPIKCPNCQNGFYFLVPKEHCGPFRDATFEAREKYYDELADGPDEPIGEIDGPSSTKSDKANESAENRLKGFKDSIKGIDKNLSQDERVPFIWGALLKMIDGSSLEIESCLRLVKDEFGLTARDIEAYRKDLNAEKDKRKRSEDKKKFDDIVARFSAPPKELTEQEKQEALAYLRDPNLINNISRDLADAGEIVGEETNKMMLYLASISRKAKKPISLVIFGKSSSGKSFLANAITKFIPEEDSLILSSSSSRAVEYLGEGLKHKFLLIQEWEGMEGILPTIRTLQSEGKLARLVTITHPEEKTPRSFANSFDCPCSVVVTTTKEGIHDENSTRIFELYADDTVVQTQNVVRETIRKANIENRRGEHIKKSILNLHQNIQRMLEPIRVSIPYAEHLSFPASTTRNRRDADRFMELIKTVAFLRQKQKEIKTSNGEQFIEADQYDYEIAYHYGIPIISATLDQISDRAKKVLCVCCALVNDNLPQVSGKPPGFTVNQIQEKAPSLGLDFKNRSDLYKQLDALTEHEYLDMNQPKPPKGTKYYTVLFQPVKDQAGNIINIGTPEIRLITTPDELRSKWKPKPSLGPPKNPGF